MRVHAKGSGVRPVKLPRRLLCGASAAAIALAAASPAGAADRWWDPNGSVSGSGGSGDWNTTSNAWSQSNNDVLGPWQAWDNVALDNAIFGTTPAATTLNPPGPITLTTPITVHNMLFQSRNGWVLGGSTLTLAGTVAEPIPTIRTDGSTTINSIIAGSAGLIKEGASSLTLTGANTFSGGIFLNAGTLSVSNNAALGHASNGITIANNVNVTFSATAGQTIDRTVTIGSDSSVTVGGGAGSALYTGTGSLRVGAGSGVSNNASTYTGTTTFQVSSGSSSTSFTSIGNLGEASSLGAPTTVANGTISWSPSGQYTDSLLYLGDGDTSNRNWSIGGNEGGTFRNDGSGALILTGDIALSNSVGIGFQSRLADFQLLGVISGTTGVSFGATALGDVTLGGNNSFTGGAAIGGGTAGNVFVPVLANSGINSSLGAGSIITLNGVLHYTGTGASMDRTWTANNGSLLSGGTGALTLSGGVTLASTLTLGGAYAGINTISGVVSGTGTLASSGTSIWELTGANTRTGAITVTGGTLQAGNASAFGTTTGVTVNGGTLDLNGFDLATPTLSSTTSLGTLALGGATLTVNSTANSSFGGSITGSGGLTKNGLGTLTLTGSNSYSGPTNINAGILRADFSVAGAANNDILSSSSAVNLSGGGILHIKGATGESNSQTIGGLNILSGANTVRTEVLAGGTLTVDFGAISRTAGMVNFDLLPNGSGNVTLTTTNADGALGGWAMIDNADYAKVVGGQIVAFDDSDYTDIDNAGDWDTLGAGQFVSDDDGDAVSFSGTVDNSVQLAGLHYDTAAHSTVTVAAGQTLGVDGAILVTPNVGNFNQTIQGGSITGSASGALGIMHNGTGVGRFSIASTIVDNGGPTAFVKGGGGTVRLTGTNTYSGATTLSGGTLEIDSLADGGVNSAIGSSSADSANLVLEGGTFHYIGATDVTTDRGFTLVNAGLGVPAIRVDAGRTIEFQGEVTSTDDQGLTKTGAGRLTLSNAANDYIGATTIGNATAVGGTLSVNILADGGLASGIGASSAASANLVLQNDGELEYTGGTVITNRGFTLGGGGGAIDVTQNSALLTIGSSGVVGAGSLTKNGDGTLILCGNNTYTGGTTVADGILRACTTTSFGTGAMTVDAGALLDLANLNTTVRGLNGEGNVSLGSGRLATNGNGSFSGTISGSGGVTIDVGTQTMSGCTNSYTGTTRIEGATLSAGCLSDGGIASDIGASPSASENLIIRDSGMLLYTGVTQTTNRGFTLENSWGYVNVEDAGTTLTFTGDVVGAAGSLVKRGSGTLELLGTNSFGGNTQIEAGILRVGSSSGLGTGGGYLHLLNVAGAALDLNGSSASFTELRGGGAAGGYIELGSGRLTVSGGGGQTYAGAISGGGGLTKSGSGTQFLTGCNSSYTGSTIITGGVLAVDCLLDGTVNSAIGASTNLATNLVLNGGTLRYTGAATTTDRLFTLGGASVLDASGSGAITFSNSGASAFVTPNTAQAVTLTGTNTGHNKLGAQITNNGTGTTSLSKIGTGTWILTNQGSTYTGVTSITGGGVLGVDKLADGGEASSIGASTNAATTLTIGTSSTLRYTGAGDSTDRLFTLDVSSTTIESSGSGAIAFTNNGLMGLSNTGQRTLSLSGSNAGDNIMGVTIRNQSAANFTSLAKNGTGKWILTGANTYTGNTNVNQGTLIIGDGGTSGSIASLNSIVAGGAVLGFDRSDIVTLAGAISGAGEVQQLGTGTTILTGTNSYTGGTTIAQGTLQLGNSGATGSIVGNVTNNGTLAFNRSNAYQFDGTISGTGQVTQIGAGTTTLTADNSYSGGTTISSGTLQVGNGGTTGSLGTGNVVNNAALTFNRSNDLALAQIISGTGTLTKLGAGMLTLTGNNGYSGLTTITAGTLQIGNGGTSGSIAGDILNNAALTFNRSNDLTYAGEVSGTGSLTKLGAGTLTLTGANSYSGPTNVNAGTLLVNGIHSGTGLTTVASGAMLGGTGTIGGDVLVNGTLTAGSNGAGTFTIGGGLALGSGSNLNLEFGAANAVGNPLNDLFEVGGDLTLDGTLNVSVTSGGSFGAGLYRVINYGGALTDNGLAIGTMPMGSEVFVQTAVSGQVNLVNTSGLTLNFWDGAAGPKFDSLVNGGDGVWQASGGNDHWTDATGVVNAPYSDGAIAIFSAAPGTVTIDDSLGAVTTAGMQFASDGYVLIGDALTLTGATAEIRVGDGSVPGAAFIATIDNELTGSSQLIKTDLGTLVLAGANTYSGGTAINGGTLQISSDANLGAAAGDLSLSGATLHTTAAMASARDVDLAGTGTFLVDPITSLILTGTLSGTGALVKSGDGLLALAGANTYAGGTTISGGTLQLGVGLAGGSIAGNVTNNGTLSFNRSDAYQFDGVISGSGQVMQIGAGTTILTADHSYTGGTTIAQGTLQIGNGGTTGSILGNVANDGTLAFNRSDDIVFAGTITGSGELHQDGAGTLTLTGTSSYAGGTNVNAGTLLVEGDLSGALGATNVVAGATLGGTGILGGDANVDGTLSAGSNGIGELTINGALTLGAGSTLAMEFGEANTPGGPLNDLVEVGGDLNLDGTIDITVAPGGSFDVGLYRVINYGGTLTDNGLELGIMPADSSVIVQTAIAGQVNLVNASDLTLNIWDGAAGPKNDGAINGGDGTWHLGGADKNWTNVAGTINAPFADASFAIFSGDAGTVTVDNSGGQVTTAGMQFASDGYVIVGDTLALVGPQAILRVGDGTLAGAGFEAVIGAELAGTSGLIKSDLGTLILTGDNSYTGGTTIAQGTLQIGNGGTTGSIAGDVVNDAMLSFNRSDELTFAGTISGSGSLNQIDSGTLILTGTNAYSGATNVNSGTLLVNGDQSLATGLTSVASGATLGGSGTIGGNVTIADGATLAPGANGVGTVTINGDLELRAGSTLNMEFGQANAIGGALNDLIEVGGDLTLDGTLNVSVPSGGAFGPGIYRVINYGGALTDNGLSLGIMPADSTATVQTAIAGQVNLLNTAGATLNFWDGAAGPKFDGVINGGDGVWQDSSGNNNWTDATGAVNAPFTDTSFAIFSSAAGTVTVDNRLGAVAASGMQFASDGYIIAGEELTLVGPQSTIRVGDGSAAGAAFDATISAELTGDSQLVKTDAGTLILSGANSYTGGTAILGGTLQIASDTNLGDTAGNISIDGGTLSTTADLASNRGMMFVGAGTIATAAGTAFTFDGLLSGSGAVTKDGAGSWILTADNSAFTAALGIAAGTLDIRGSLGSLVTIGAEGRLEGTGHVGSVVNTGVLAPGSSGFGTLTIDGDYTGGGSLEIETVLGGDMSETDRLVIAGASSGETEVNVLNRDGLGAQTAEGIKIIDIGGASNGTFTLNGDYLFEGMEAIVAGAFAYTLQKSGVSTPSDGDWYLRSELTDPTVPPQTPLYQPGVPVYEAYADALMTLNRVPTWRQRIGGRSAADATGVWGRVEAERRRADAAVSTSFTDVDSDVAELQAGLDRVISDSDKGSLVLGVTGHYRALDAGITSLFGNGGLDIKGYGIGATLSWYGAGGLYVDGQAQVTSYKADLESSTLGALADGNDGDGHAFSLEVGQQVGRGSVTLTPQAQLVYSKIGFDRFTDPNGASVSSDKGQSLRGRLGATLDFALGDTREQRGGFYALANLHYELLDGSRTAVSGTPLVRRDGRTWGELGIGGTYGWGRLSLYGELSLNSGLKDLGDSYSVKGQAGLRLNF